MPRKSNTVAAARLDLLGPKIGDLYLKGKTYREIGLECGLTIQQVYDTITYAKKLWRDRNQDVLAEKIAELLRRIDLIEKEAWLMLERSQQRWVEYAKTIEDSGGDPATKVRKVTRKSRNQHGDARCLQIALECVEKRCKLMGAYNAALRDEKGDSMPRGIMVVVETPEEAEKILSYSEFEAMAERGREYMADQITHQT